MIGKLRNLALFFLAAAVMCLVGAAAVSAAPTNDEECIACINNTDCGAPNTHPRCASNGFCMGHCGQ